MYVLKCLGLDCLNDNMSNKKSNNKLKFTQLCAFGCAKIIQSCKTNSGSSRECKLWFLELDKPNVLSIISNQ